METFYSQYGQDKYIYENFFSDKRKGFYVDIGAYDGVELSNTFFFEKIGWEGCCFEPSPEVFNCLQNNRRAACYPAAIGHQNKTTTFLRVTGVASMLSGVLDYYSPDHMFRINKETFESGGEQDGIDVDMHTLDYFLPPGKEINYLSLDTEGGEGKILENILQFFTPQIISVEANYQAEAQKIIEITKDKYDLVKQLGCDLILVIK